VEADLERDCGLFAPYDCLCAVVTLKGVLSGTDADDAEY
jgi:hypothetical protein